MEIIKKEYIEPTIEEIMINSNDIVVTSDFNDDRPNINDDDGDNGNIGGLDF